MTLSAVGIANLALDELPHKALVSLNDNVIAAAPVRRQLPQVLGELMEMGEWPFAVKRQALTSPAVNDRSQYWTYAYVAPTDLAVPLRIIRTADTYDGASFLGPGQTLASTAVSNDMAIGFDFEGANLWSNEPNAVLEYITATPEYATFSKRFERVLALTLASRLAMPVLKDRQRKIDLLNEAEAFYRRTMAAEMNKNPTQNRYGDNFIPSSLMGHATAPE